MNLQAIFDAGRVRRWHSNPDMSHTDDYNDAHQGRVARIILALHPNPSKRLIFAALMHDDGESLTGDFSFEFKRQFPALREQIRIAEHERIVELWGFQADLLPTDKKWLKFADCLDSYMWMVHKARHLAYRVDWAEQREWLIKTAEELNVTLRDWKKE